MKLYHKYVHKRGWLDITTSNPQLLPLRTRIKSPYGLSLAWAMLYFILKTFYHENFQNMQQWKEYFNELSHPVTVSSDYRLVAHPFIHTPPLLPTPILGLSWSKAQRDILSGILTHLGAAGWGPGDRGPWVPHSLTPVWWLTPSTHTELQERTPNPGFLHSKLLRKVSQLWSSYFLQVSKDPCL